MAFIVKNQKAISSSASKTGQTVLDQWTQVTCAARTVPATTTDQIFRVRGGRCVVKRLVGEVTTVIQAQADNMKVTSKKLDTASAAVGTAVDICANVDINGKEVGASLLVEGDGTAGVLSNAGAILGAAGADGTFVVPQGEIYITTSATNTGAMKWDIWYQPLDAGAYIDPVAVATVAI